MPSRGDAVKREIQRLRRLFDKLDLDGDGVVSLIELREILNHPQHTDLTHKDVEQIFRATDHNDNNAIEFREFAIMMTDRRQASSMYRRGLYAIADSVTPRDQRAVTHSYLSAYNCCPPPLFIPIITLVEIGIFVYYGLTTDDVNVGFFTGCPGCYQPDGDPGVLIFAPVFRAQAWRFVSYMLLHAGLAVVDRSVHECWEHLIGNMVMQLLVGIPLELVHKGWRVAPLYLIAVVFGAMLQYTFDPNTLLVGASGGVYALIVAHLANTILNWAEMPFGWVRLILFGVYICFDFGFAIYRRFFTAECNQISVAAHAGGAITGFLLGFVFVKNLNWLKWERVLFWLSLVLYVLLLTAATAAVIIRSPGDAAWLECASAVEHTVSTTPSEFMG